MLTCLHVFLLPVLGEMSIWAVSVIANKAEANSYPGQPILERGCCLVVKTALLL